MPAAQEPLFGSAIALIAAPAGLARTTAAPYGGPPPVKRGLVKILSPRDESIAQARTVRIRVRTRPGVSGFKAVLGTRSVTRRFSRPRKGVRTAVFRVGGGVRRGE